MNVVSNEAVSNECGLECGLKRIWSEMNVVSHEKVSN